MKKLVALILTLCLALTACSALAETTLKLGIYPEDVDTAAVESHEFYLAEFAKLLPDVVVEKAHYKYATDTFIPMAQAHTVPTIFETWFTEPPKLIKGKFVADITDILDGLGWTDKMNPSIRKLVSDENGRIYGVPRDGYSLGLMINAELFRDAGLVDADGIPTYPKTWEELAEYGKIIKEKTGSAGFCLLAQDNAGGWHFSNIAWCFGAKLQSQDADGKWTCDLNSKEAVAAMQYVYDLRYKYNILTADPTSENWGTGFTQLGTGACAMYIGATDAMNQIALNGLALEDFMYVGIPAGPGGAYSLFGGTPYCFSADATEDEIKAALTYLEVMGKAPVLTDAAKAGLIADAKYRKENNIPVIDQFPCWVDEELNKARMDVVSEYSNVDQRMFAPFYAATTAEGNLHQEEPQETQLMYAELTKVLQAVVTEETVDIQALMDTADANFQQILDEKVNNPAPAAE